MFSDHYSQKVRDLVLVIACLAGKRIEGLSLDHPPAIPGRTLPDARVSLQQYPIILAGKSHLWFLSTLPIPRLQKQKSYLREALKALLRLNPMPYMELLVFFRDGCLFYQIVPWSYQIKKDLLTYALVRFKILLVSSVANQYATNKMLVRRFLLLDPLHRRVFSCGEEVSYDNRSCFTGFNSRVHLPAFFKARLQFSSCESCVTKFTRLMKHEGFTRFEEVLGE